MDDYDSGDNLLADIDPDELASPKKRALDDDSGGDGAVHMGKRVKINTSSAQDGNNVELARSILRQKFGYDNFRHEQEIAIEAILRGDNTLVVFPTGAGKSLCYQVCIIQSHPQVSSNINCHLRSLLLLLRSWTSRVVWKSSLAQGSLLSCLL